MPECFCPDSWIPNLVNAGLLLRSKSASSSFIPDDNSILAFFILMVRFILFYTQGKVHPFKIYTQCKVHPFLYSRKSSSFFILKEKFIFFYTVNSLYITQVLNSANQPFCIKSGEYRIANPNFFYHGLI